jgi:hypothetical protein
MPSVYSYFGYTHRFLGETLKRNLPNQTQVALSDYFDVGQLGKISTWADTIKRKPGWQWTRPQHYIDLNACVDMGSIIEMKSVCQNNCIYTAILNLTNEVKYNVKYQSSEQTSTNLKLLIHYMQDLFQPMHTFGGRLGGNNWKIKLEQNGKIRNTNMHSLWDSIIPEYYIQKFVPLLALDNYQNFTGMLEFENYLKEKLWLVSKIACEKTRNIGDTIRFDDYFDKHVVLVLFRNYLEFAVSVLVFVTHFEKN